MKYRLSLFLLAFFFIGVYSALSQRIIFNKVLPPHGRTFTHVTGIVQDNQGYMWFATKKGLYKYDGYTMVSYKNDPLNPNSLASNLLESISIDSSGTIWVGTTAAGLDSFDPVSGNFTHFRHNSQQNGSIINDTIFAILTDRNGILWVGTPAGLDRLDRKTGKFIHYRNHANDTTSISSNMVRALYEDKQGTLWIGTGSPYPSDGGGPEDGGLNRLDKTTGKFTRYLHKPNNPQSLINNKVRAIFEDSKGIFWVGTAGDGLHTMDRMNGVFEKHRYDPFNPKKLSRPPISGLDPWEHITFIREDVTGAIWIGTTSSGINLYNPKTKQITHYRSDSDTSGRLFSNQSTWWAYSSRDGVLWISTITGNLYRIDPFRRNIPYEYLGGFVNSFYEETDNVLWLGTLEGLVRIDRNKGSTKRFVNDPQNPASLSHNFVQQVIQDREGNIWVGTHKGLNLMNKHNETFTRYHHNAGDNNSLINDQIVTIYEDRKANLWIGTAKGLELMNAKTGSFIHYKIYPDDTSTHTSNMVSATLEDTKGKLWVGSYLPYGIHQLNRENGKFRHYLKGIRILSIYEDSEGTLWAGSDDGLYQFNRNEEDFVRFVDPDSQIEIEEVNSIVEDDKKNLWLGTPNGIIRLNPHQIETRIYGKNFNIEGNDLNFVSGYKGGRGELFFGNSSGYLAFFPDQFSTNSTPPQIVFTNFRMGDQDVKAEKNSPLTEPLSQIKKIRLHHDQNIFSFDFAAIDYSNPDDNRHLFMLENYDNSWHNVGSERRAYYFNIPPGKYIFRVRGINSNYVWAERTIDIIITPPWWRTWWAYSLFALLFIGIVWSFIYFRSRSLVKEKKLLEEKVNNRTIEVVNQKKEIENQRDNLSQTLDELKATQAQLVQREKMASLGELTAGIAHEIQNPLNFVNNFSEVNTELIEEMRQEIDKGNMEEVKTIAENIEENEQKISHHGKRADAIVKGMLQHSRSNSGVKEPTDINALADEYLRLAYHGLRAKDKSFNATLETDYDASIGKIDIIPQDIGRVILNLITNAFYAVTEKKKQIGDGYEPTVSMTTKKLNGKVEIKVGDNGMGISQKIMEKIFQPFFTTKPTGAGTGLGLSLSYDIIKAHGGELKVETKEGDYAEFIIILQTSY